mgnify:CR=1 FL=1
MSDESDTCGAETVADSPCQNPTTDDGDPDRCWIPSHNDPDAGNPHGRDFAIDEGDHDDILQAARDGMSKAGCARAAGVDEKSLARYLDAHDDFRRAFTRARHEGERFLVREALIDSPDDPREIDGQHARFLLSTSFDYVKTEKQELEHSTDEDTDLGTTIVVSGEYDPRDVEE